MYLSNNELYDIHGGCRALRILIKYIIVRNFRKR